MSRKSARKSSQFDRHSSRSCFNQISSVRRCGLVFICAFVSRGILPLRLLFASLTRKIRLSRAISALLEESFGLLGALSKSQGTRKSQAFPKNNIWGKTYDFFSFSYAISCWFVRFCTIVQSLPCSVKRISGYSDCRVSACRYLYKKRDYRALKIPVDLRKK